MLVNFDPSVVSYQELLDAFGTIRILRGMTDNFVILGSSIRPVIFYHNAKQKELAEKSKEAIIAANKVQPILVDILPATKFYPAEEYHQEY